jgi:hypothetical protein
MQVSTETSMDGGKDRMPSRPMESESDPLPTEPPKIGSGEEKEPPEDSLADAATTAPEPPMCNVVPVFERNCAGSGCHGTTEAATLGGSDLIYQLDADSLAESVYCDGLLIDPENLEDSLLLNKLEAEPLCGLKMPPLTEMSKEDKIASSSGCWAINTRRKPSTRAVILRSSVRNQRPALGAPC